MHATSVSLKNYRCFDSISVDLHPNCNLFIANNGEGKTSFVDGFAAALGAMGEAIRVPTGSYLCSSDVRFSFVSDTNIRTMHFPTTVKASLEFSDNTLAETYRTADGQSNWLKRPKQTDAIREYFKKILLSESHTWPVFAYYNCERLERFSRHFEEDEKKFIQSEYFSKSLEAIGSNPKKIPTRVDGWINCLNAKASWEAVRTWWALEYISAFAGGNETSSLCRAVEKSVACAFKDKLDISWSPSARDIVFHMKNRGRRTLSSLSDGYKSIVSIFADTSWRCSMLNPHLGEKAPLETPGIILIDEIELHLHPEWQRSIIASLRKAFPRIQFVITTHSPQVLGSVSDESTFVIEDFKVEKSLSETYGKDTNRILRSIMKTTTRERSIETLFGQLEQFVDEEFWSDAWTVVDQIRNLLGESDPELTYYVNFLPQREVSK